jgi:hypothetical protein
MGIVLKPRASDPGSQVSRESPDDPIGVSELRKFMAYGK